MKRPVLIAFLSGLLPVIAVHAAYLLNIFGGGELQAGYVCWPYYDGCVSISRAARSGPGLHLFRAVMLPCAVLLLLSWDFVREWLIGLNACSRKRAWIIFMLGAVGALFLVFYVAWLGTEGEWYRWLRRYGVTFYFAGTALAQLLLVWVLWPVRQELARGLLVRPVAVLAGLVSLQWILGVFSAFKSLIFVDPELIERIENVIEWCYALPMALAFIVIAWMFHQTGFRVRVLMDR